MIQTVDTYLEEGCGRCKLWRTPECKAILWRPVLEKIRSILLDCLLVEEIKWSMPCYTYQGKNVIILYAFKDGSNIGFFKGALLQDELKLLHLPGENSQSSRFLKFTTVQQVEEMEATIKAYVFEAIELEKAGEKVVMKKLEEYVIPQELQQRMDENAAFKEAFNALTPGRQKGYILHFSGAKQSETRLARIDKYRDLIMQGKGIHDDYKSRK